MLKMKTVLIAYFFAISTIFQVSSFPANEEFEYDDIGVTSLPIQSIQDTESLVPLPTIEDIEEILALEDSGEKMKRIQKYGVETVGHLMDFAKKTIEEVDELVEESEIAIRNLKAESKSLDLEQFAFTKNFISKFNDAKKNLLDARRDLVGLASQTVLICDNIEILIKDWQDEHAVVLLKSQFENLRRLIDETKTSLSSAKEKYVVLIDTWLTIDEEIATFKVKLNRASDTNSADYNKWVTQVRAGGYTAAGAVTAGMIIADIFGCLGFCSGIVTTGTWISTAASAEAAIAKYGAEIKSLENQVDNAIIQLGKLDQTAENAVELMTNEMNLVIKWESAALNIENTINDYTIEQMQAIKAFQNIFANSITKLKAAAYNFYNFASTKKPSLEI
jgi:hypothetical protein